MNALASFRLLLLTLALLLTAPGCGKSGPPQPLPPGQAPAELDQAFAKAKAEVKEVATQAVAALQAGKYPEASALLLELSRAPDLDGREREAVTRVMIGVNQLLQEAQAKGDPQATEHLRRLRQSK